MPCVSHGRAEDAVVAGFAAPDEAPIDADEFDVPNPEAVTGAAGTATGDADDAGAAPKPNFIAAPGVVAGDADDADAAAGEAAAPKPNLIPAPPPATPN